MKGKYLRFRFVLTQGREKKTASWGKNGKKRRERRGEKGREGRKQGRRGIINNSIETDKRGKGTNPLKVLQKTLNFPLLWVEGLIHFPLEVKGQVEDFPGGPVPGSLHSHGRGPILDPWSGS